MEKARKQDLLGNLKRDHEFSKEVIAVMRSTAGQETVRRSQPTSVRIYHDFLIDYCRNNRCVVLFVKGFRTIFHNGRRRQLLGQLNKLTPCELTPTLEPVLQHSEKYTWSPKSTVLCKLVY